MTQMTLNLNLPLHVGQVARFLGIPRRRVQWWIERGFLRVEPDPRYGRGHHFRLHPAELDIAVQVLRIQETLGVEASEKLFAHVRSLPINNGNSEATVAA